MRLVYYLNALQTYSTMSPDSVEEQEVLELQEYSQDLVLELVESNVERLLASPTNKPQEGDTASVATRDDSISNSSQRSSNPSDSETEEE